MTHILALDQGTTSSRALLFDGDLRPVRIAQEEFPQIFPASGWVEHDPEAIWATTLATAKRALDGLAPEEVAALGITNQRETTLVWDRETGRPVHNAIVWQDRRTAPLCETLSQEGWGETVADRTGLLLDP